VTAILTALLSAGAAFVGAWLAARFALDRFYHERIWERRAAAYTAVFEALHDQAKWYGVHIRAMIKGREIPIDEAAKLSNEYMKASSDLQRRIVSETWLISDRFRERIEKMIEDLNERQEDWPTHLEKGQETLESAEEDLRTIARDELAVPSDKLN
jgi:hypothetical protein